MDFDHVLNVLLQKSIKNKKAGYVHISQICFQVNKTDKKALA